jgi:hypothetical protein
VRTTSDVLTALGLPARDAYDLPTSRKRFPDGGQYRVEIPSVEGPKAMEGVLSAAGEHGVGIHRVSQGSGILLQTDDETRRMLALGPTRTSRSACSWDPRAAWDTGIQASSTLGRVVGSSLRGADQLAYGIEDVRHGCALGLRSILVSDLGQLVVLGRMKKDGDLPPDLGPEDLGHAGRREPRDRAPARGPGRDVDQPAGRPRPPADRGHPAGDRRGDRPLRGGARRHRRRGAALRDPRSWCGSRRRST